MAIIVTEFEYELVRAVQRFSVEGLLSPGFGLDALFLQVVRFLFSFIPIRTFSKHRILQVVCTTECDSS